MCEVFDDQILLASSGWDVSQAAEIVDGFLRTISPDLLRLLSEIESDRRGDLHERAMRMSRELAIIGGRASSKACSSLSQNASDAPQFMLKGEFQCIVAETYLLKEKVKQWLELNRSISHVRY